MDEEETDLKPDKVKFESELILDDDETDNYFTGPCQEACDQVQREQSPVVTESSDLDVSEMVLKIKQEKIEDEEPMAECYSEVSPCIQSTTFVEVSTVEPERIDLNVGDSFLATDEFASNLHEAVIIKEEITEDTTAIDPLKVDGQPNSPEMVPSTSLDGSVFVKMENNLVEGHNVAQKQQQSLEEMHRVKSEEPSGDSGTHLSSASTVATFLISEAGTVAGQGGMFFNNTYTITHSGENQSLELTPSGASHEEEIKSEHHGAEIDDQTHRPANQGSSTDTMVFSCNQCSVSFGTSDELKLHMVIHSDKRSFPCEKCPARFLTSFELAKHLIVHANEKNFRCKYCSARFKTNEELDDHFLIHTKERKFACSQCSDRFKEKRTLERHLTTHSDARPFSCQLCPAQFKLNYVLQNHMLTHSDERAFSCTQCNQKFKSRQNWRLHEQVTHSDKRAHRCSRCRTWFKRKSDLKSHMLLHSDERAFCCDECGARFRKKSTLRSHLSTHSGPLSCTLCSAKYKQKSTLQKHLRTHSNASE